MSVQMVVHEMHDSVLTRAAGGRIREFIVTEDGALLELRPE